jgi:hypothetical protein
VVVVVLTPTVETLDITHKTVAMAEQEKLGLMETPMRVVAVVMELITLLVAQVAVEDHALTEHLTLVEAVVVPTLAPEAVMVVLV